MKNLENNNNIKLWDQYLLCSNIDFFEICIEAQFIIKTTPWEQDGSHASRQEQSRWAKSREIVSQRSRPVRDMARASFRLAVQVTTRACVHVNNVSATISAVLYHSLSADLLPHVIIPATKLNSWFRATYVPLYPETTKFRHLRKGRNRRGNWFMLQNVNVHTNVELKTCNLCAKPFFVLLPGRLPLVRKYS